jgi:hypothetical protein
MIKFNYLLLLALICLIVSCSDKFEGIVVNTQKVKFYNYPDTLSKKAGLLKPGDLVEIMDTTLEKYSINSDEDNCSKFPFVKVKNKLGKTGWISGKYVFKIDRKYLPKYLNNNNLEFKFQNQMYTIHYGRNFGVGALSSEGITGCDDFYPIILYNKDTKLYQLIKNFKNPNSTYLYSILLDDNNTNEEIASVKTINDRIILSINCSYQEGGGFYEYSIKKTGNEFIGESFNYQIAE